MFEELEELAQIVEEILNEENLHDETSDNVLHKEWVPQYMQRFLDKEEYIKLPVRLFKVEKDKFEDPDKALTAFFNINSKESITSFLKAVEQEHRKFRGCPRGPELYRSVRELTAYAIYQFIRNNYMTPVAKNNFKLREQFGNIRENLKYNYTEDFRNNSAGPSYSTSHPAAPEISRYRSRNAGNTMRFTQGGDSRWQTRH